MILQSQRVVLILIVVTVFLLTFFLSRKGKKDVSRFAADSGFLIGNNRVEHHLLSSSMMQEAINGYKVCLNDEKSNLAEKLLEEARTQGVDDTCVNRAELKELVILTGHSQYIGSDFKRASEDDSWVIRPYQIGHGKVFYSQIERAVSILAERTKALLVFSGGAIELLAPPIPEAVSYWVELLYI